MNSPNPLHFLPSPPPPDLFFSLAECILHLRNAFWGSTGAQVGGLEGLWDQSCLRGWKFWEDLGQ